MGDDKITMYPKFNLLKKYLRYNFTAANSNGHGVHSPFVFDFITNILRDKKNYPVYERIEKLRQQLLCNGEILEVEDLGAGSGEIKSAARKIKAIAASSLKNKKFGQLLFRIVQYYKPGTIIELGTSLGITTNYLAAGNPLADVYTLEGSKNIASVAIKNFALNQSENIALIVGNFDHTLPETLNKLDKIDLAFIDGNHRKAPTLNYFELLFKKSGIHSVFIFDDIHWSDEMEEAWNEIQQHPSVTLTIDLFFVGLVFFSPQFKVRQHFTIRF
jgi:predicted O-methyltransferase YrrM